MSNKNFKKHNGDSLASIEELSRKTAEYSGVPYETANYIISSFIDILYDEIVVNGGAILPGIATFYPKPIPPNAGDRFANGVKYLSDRKIDVHLPETIKTIYQMQRIYCKNNDKRIGIPSTWRDFSKRYAMVLKNNKFGSGIIALTKALKKDAKINSKNKNDYLELNHPIINPYFKNLIDEMNEVKIYDTKFHKDTGESLTSGENRLIQSTDINELSVSAIYNSRAEKVSDI